MAAHPFEFGVFVPQGWKMELASIPDPQAKWAKAVEIAELAETLGYDSIWVYDHFHNVPQPAHETMFECWTTLAAISQRTSRVRLGQMVGCAPYRNPGLLAKITSNIDVISGGRLDWGIGAGWYQHEFQGYGYEFKSAKERIGVLRETVEIVKSMWSEPDTTYDGTYFQLKGAQCDPKPLQQPHPPIWIGGGGEQLTLRVVARHADRSNFGGKPHEFQHKCEVLQEHCKAVGRDYDDDREDVVARGVHPRERARDRRRRYAQLHRGTVRLLACRQSRRYTGTSRGEGAGVRRPRLHGLRAVVLGLSRTPNRCASSRRRSSPTSADGDEFRGVRASYG